ncbi:MAG: hypothetical protein JW891_11755 [Candidatus Lokiarchaeota archaeon]|nr:hypothetical protein [Candidatus Lokiarchaeota archaeon]
MVNKEKILENYKPTDVVGKFFALGVSEKRWIHGEILLPNYLDMFVSIIQSEIEYSWGKECAYMGEYFIYHIDTEHKDDLKLINDNEYYKKVRSQKRIFIALVHKSIPYRIIENIPLLFDWYEENYLD